MWASSPPKDGVSTAVMTTGIAYTSELTDHVIETAAGSRIVQEQLADETVNVFTGAGFDEENESQLRFEDMISVDGDAISSAFGMDISTDSVMNMMQSYLNDVLKTLEVDTTPARNDFLSTFQAFATEMLNGFVGANADASGAAKLYLTDVEGLVDGFLASDSAQTRMAALGQQYSLPAETFSQVYRPLMCGMLNSFIAQSATQEPEVPPTEPDVPDETPGQTEPAQTEPPQTEPEATAAPTEAPVTEPSQPVETTPERNETQPEPTVTTASVLTAEELGIQVNASAIYGDIRPEDVEKIVSDYMQNAVVTGTAGAMSAKMMEATIRSAVLAQVATFGQRLTTYIGSAMTVDANKISSAFHFNMTEDDLRRLMSAMSSQSQTSGPTANLQALGYADTAEPTGMSIYLVDFAGKEEFMDFLDDYNADMEACDQEDKVIRYTDVTGIMMSSVRTIIDSVSYALIAFVAVSLVVSSIMIGIITYISVMERTKEIGVLRAIGASKRNISQVFNAETFIIGLCSGLLGIGVTLLILIPGNQLLLHLTGNPDIKAQLPLVSALVLIGLSVLLTLIGGFIPAKKAAKKDPVIALRSE